MDPMNATYDMIGQKSSPRSPINSTTTVNAKLKSGLSFKENNQSLALILKETVPPPMTSLPTLAPVLPPDAKYEDPFPEKRVETGNKIASIMAEERQKRAEFKEFQKKLKESREAILL